MTSREPAATITSSPSPAIPLLVSLLALLPVPCVEAEELADELAGYAHRIVYETFRDDNWELFVTSADGSESVNLTQTPEINELYAHASPDGTKIAFVVDEGTGASKVRNVYWMNMDGTGRTLVAENARQECWKSDGTAIAYLKGESDQFTYTDYATTGIVVYDLATGRRRQHPRSLR